MQTSDQLRIFLRRLEVELTDLRESYHIDYTSDDIDSSEATATVNICNAILNATREAQEMKQEAESKYEYTGKEKLLSCLRKIEDRIEKNNLLGAYNLTKNVLLPEIEGQLPY